MITISEAEEVLQRLRDEVRRVQYQIIISRAVTSSSNDNNNGNHVINDVGEVAEVEEEISKVNSDNYDKDDKKESAQESNLEHSPIIANVANIAEVHRIRRKSGLLLHLVRKSLFSSKEIWVLHYFIVKEEHGISWYDIKQNNKEKYEVTNALGHVPFWCTTYNSRGSRFKRACVCWPILLASDYPSLMESKIAANTPMELLETSSSSSSFSANIINDKANGEAKREMLQNNSPSLYCFGIEFYKESKQAHEMIVLASVDAQTRREWVYFLSQYMDWYIPAGRELQINEAGMQRACEIPMHRSAVLDGEAPRSPS